MTKKQAKGVISLKVPADIKAALDRAAESDRRPLAHLVVLILESWLSDHGLIDKRPSPLWVRPPDAPAKPIADPADLIGRKKHAPE